MADKPTKKITVWVEDHAAFCEMCDARGWLQAAMFQALVAYWCATHPQDTAAPRKQLPEASHAATRGEGNQE